ncbi:hypothetical protein WA158_007434 [Blastocystis sp. Blastoise]
MKEFKIPLTIDNLLQQQEDRYFIENLTSCDDLDSNECLDFVERLQSDIISDGSYNLILQQDNFDILFSLIKYYSSISDEVRCKLNEFLLSFAQRFYPILRNGVTDEYNDVQLRDIMKILIYCFSIIVKEMDVLYQSVINEDALNNNGKGKKKKRINNGGTNWEDYIYQILTSMNEGLRIDFLGFWRMNIPEETYLQLYYRTVLFLLEKNIYLKNNNIQELMLDIITFIIVKYPSTVSPLSVSLLHLLSNLEHTPAFMAKLNKILYKNHNNISLYVEFIKEISTYNFSENSKNTMEIKNISSFITELGDQCPLLLSASLILLLPLLNKENYMIRCAIITGIGGILKGCKMTEEEEMRNYHDRQSRTKSLMAGNTENGATMEIEGEIEEKETKTITMKTRYQLLDILRERACDINAFARAATIKTWITLCEDGAIPLNYWSEVTCLTIERIKDKAVLVRKYSIQLLTSLLEHNPYQGVLNPSLYKQKLTELETVLKVYTEDDIQREEQNEDPMTDYKKAKRLYLYYSSLNQFCDTIATAIPSLCQLLSSKNDTDVQEALDFFGIGYKFKIPNLTTGLRKMLALIWSNSPSIVKEVILTLKHLYFTSSYDESGDDVFYPPIQIAKNLIGLLSGASISERTSLEECVRHLTGEGLITDDVIDILWSLIYKEKDDEMIRENSLCLLSMIAGANASAVYHPQRILKLASFVNRNDISSYYIQIKYIFNIWGRIQIAPSLSDEDCNKLISEISAFFRKTTLSIDESPSSSSLENDNNRGEDANKMDIEEETHSISDNQENSMKLPSENPTNSSTTNVYSYKYWYQAAEAGVNSIFILCKRPDIETESILHHISAILFETRKTQIVSRQLSRFMFIAGHIAIKLLVFSEYLAKEAKKSRQKHQETLRDIKKEKETMKGKREDEEELGLVGSVDDAEEELLEDIARNEIVNNNFLGSFAPLLLAIVKNEDNIYHDTELRESCVLTLCKYCSICKDFCEQNLSLLITLLHRAPEEYIRTNIIITVGDLFFRYPNMIEPWTPHLYGALRDKSPLVQKDCLMVLTHLILNDMIKIKGQIAEIALCLVNKNIRIQQLAELFFLELAKRGNNPVYNIFPDCISLLINNEDLPFDDFSKIVKYISQFIDKEKQCTTLVDKLCQRIAATAYPRHWKCIVFTIYSLPLTSSSCIPLLEHKKELKDLLADEEINKLLQQVLSKLKRGTKVDNQQAIEELTTFINNNGEDEEELSSVPPTPSTITRSTRTKRSRPLTTPQTERVKPRKTPAKRTESKSKKIARKIQFDSDSDNDIVEEFSFGSSDSDS